MNHHKTIHSLLGALAAVAGASGCLDASEALSRNADELAVSPTTRLEEHITPISMAPVAACGGADFKNYGGPVVSNVKVVSVMWGSATNPTLSPSFPAFYRSLVASPYMEMLAELGVGLGSFVGQFTITPMHTTQSLTDVDIANEIKSQADAGNLPSPDGNTVYMVQLPRGFSASTTFFGVPILTTVNLCSQEGAGGWHTSKTVGGRSIRFAVNIDHCLGWASTLAASHELIETLTDPDSSGWHTPYVTPSLTCAGNPQEIGDLCEEGDVGWLPAPALDTSFTVEQAFLPSKYSCWGQRRWISRDLLWRNINGEPRLWTIQPYPDTQFDITNMPTTNIQGTPLIPGNDWTINGVGDFDGDGISDILWRDRDSGFGTSVEVWLMNANGSIKDRPLLCNATSAAAGCPSASYWNVVGVADIDGDGKSDILWRGADGASGTEVRSWLVDGGHVRAGIALCNPSVSGSCPHNDWVVLGTSDLDRDGTSDILWRDSDGTLQVWSSLGNQNRRSNIETRPPTTWQYLGVGDVLVQVQLQRGFSNLPKSGTFWRCIDSRNVLCQYGQIESMTIDGGMVASHTVIDSNHIAVTVPPSLTFLRVADIDGDGNPDLLWRNTTTGAIVMWTMDQWIVVRSRNARFAGIDANVGLDWSLQGVGSFD